MITTISSFEPSAAHLTVFTFKLLQWVRRRVIEWLLDMVLLYELTLNGQVLVIQFLEITFDHAMAGF